MAVSITYILWLDAPATETEKPSLPKLLKQCCGVVAAVVTDYLSLWIFLLRLSE